MNNADEVMIVYSSKTGNTRAVAEGIARGLGENVRIVPIEDAPEGSAGVLLLGVWVDRGTADAKSLAYIEKLEGRKVGLFGTLGAEADSDHARKTGEALTALVAAKNTCLGCFLCQGKIDPALTEQFKSLPPDHPHAMDEKRMKRHLEAAKHPDQADIERALAACKAMLTNARSA
ncbi:MAG: flavodoxin family protein [Treponema sp.]|jgi:flavodoxin|nr:flavodoxin family protein [Treponema sp.]